MSIIGLGVVSTVFYMTYLKLPRLVPAFSNKSDIQLYVYLFLFLWAVYLFSVFLILRNKFFIGKSATLLVIIIFFAILFRLSLIPRHPTVLSNDMYRYIWDGRVQQSGISPYRYAPADEALKGLRDPGVYPHINRKEYPTIYPAGAQLFFRVFYALAGDSVPGYKGFMVFFDLLTILVLAALLKAHGYERERLIIYAWNPLVIFEIAYSGHLEALTVFFMVAAFYMTALRKKGSGVILLALSSAVKMYPALLLSAVLNRGHRIKGMAIFFATLALLYLPYMSVGSKISGFLPVYLKNPHESFNLGLKPLLMHLFPGLDYYLLSQLFIVAMAAFGLLVFFREKHGLEILWYAYLTVGVLIILMPASLQPWYVILIIPFLTFYPSPAWLIFTCTVTLSYLKYVSDQEIMPTWVLMAEYVPLFALLLGGFALKRWGALKWGTGLYSNAKANNQRR